MSANEGIKLFKLASQINVGKSEITDFLNTQGFVVEAKATATITDEMVDAVMAHFKKEYDAKQKQNQKVEEHKKIGRPKDEQEAHPKPTIETHSIDSAQTLFVEVATEPTIQSEPKVAEPEILHIEVMHEVAIPAKLEIPTVELITEQKPEPPTAIVEQKQEANAIQVGTVIQLDKFGGNQKGKQNPPKFEKKEGKFQSPKLQQQPVKKADEPKQEIVVKPIIEPKAVEKVQVQPELQVAPIAPLEIAPAIIPTPEPIVAPVEVPIVAPATEEEAHHEDEFNEDGSRKKKKKKKMGELQYQTGSGFQLPGLTILGKIDLVSNRKKTEERGKKKNWKKEKGIEEKPKVVVKPVVDTTKEKPKPKEVPVKKLTALEQADTKKTKKRKKAKWEKVSAVEVDKAIRRTLAGAEDSAVVSRSKMRQKRRLEREEKMTLQAEADLEAGGILHVTEFITASELAHLLGVDVNQIILKCLQLGLMVSINQRLDKDTITLIAGDFDLEVEFEEEFSSDIADDEVDAPETLQSRAPIVTIMGHVDHGKTSLLDYIRNANVVAGEAGGITQHIGAYNVLLKNGKRITFLDTPGHQAFTAMRARGAQITDIVVLVVAADDSVMPQTLEAISHSKAASVPIVVAINKIDRADSKPERIKQQLADQDVLVEDWGGKYQCAEISARQGLNIDSLLDKILLEAEILDLKANPNRKARGTVIESRIDKGKGPVSTIIVQKGTLRVGDSFICGVWSGRVKAMMDERGNSIDIVYPGMPVQIVGFDGPPQAGDVFVAMESISEAKHLATKRQQIKREQEFKQIRHLTLDDISKNIQTGGVQDLNIVLKADADGSVEAITDSLQKLSNQEVRVSVIHKGVGAISETDIMLAAASNAIVIGFHIRPTLQAKKLAEVEAVDVRIYNIIYDCINEIKSALEGMLNPEIKEEISGTVEIREVFKISKIGNVAGCYVLDGKITRNDVIRLIRDGFEIYTGRLSTLRRIKDDVREVEAGYECGLTIENYNDIRVGDIIESVKKVEIKRKLV